MKIYNITSTNFLAKNSTNVTKTKVFNSKKFYSEIDKFVNKKITKEEFLKDFERKYKKFLNHPELSLEEKNFINDIIATFEFGYSAKDISSKILMERIKELLSLRK